MKGTAFCLGLVLLVTAQQSTAQNEPWPPIPTGATTASLGSYLEGPFQVAQGYCINQNPSPVKLTISKWKGLKSQALSAIPPQLDDPSLRLNDTVLITGDESVGRAFSYVYSGQTAVVQNPSPLDFLAADYLQDPATMAADGFNGALYDYNCTSSFAASLKANAGWTFPIASIASALQADATGQTQFHFALVSGILQSPIWSFYKSTITQDQKTYAALLMWEWYLRHPDALTDSSPRYLLTDFDGVAVFKVATHSLSTDGKVSASAAFSSPAVNINAALQAAYQSSSRAQVTSYGLVIRELNGKEKDHFQPFPSGAALAAQLTATGRAHLDQTSTDLRLQTNDMDHVQIITGVPQVVCSRPWHTELSQGTSMGGSLNVKSAKYIDPTTSPSTALPSCRITVTYSPGTPLPERVTLDYYLTTDLVDSASTVKATAKFKADNVSLSASGLPAVGGTSSRGQVDPGFPTTSTVGSITFFTYQWTVSYPIKEDAASNAVKIAAVDFDPQGAQLTCGSRKITPISPSASYIPASGATGTMTIVVAHASDDQHEKLDPSQLEFCNLDAGLIFTLNSGASVPRKLPATQLLYPRVAQSPTAPPAASASPAVVQPR